MAKASGLNSSTKDIGISIGRPAARAISFSLEFMPNAVLKAVVLELGSAAYRQNFALRVYIEPDFFRVFKGNKRSNLQLSNMKRRIADEICAIV